MILTHLNRAARTSTVISNVPGVFATDPFLARLPHHEVDTDQSHPVDEEADHPDADDLDHAPEAVVGVAMM